MYEMKQVVWNQPNENDYNIINQFVRDYDLKFNEQVLYSIANDCSSCT